MTNEEFDKLCEELIAQGMTEKDILGVVLQMFEDGKIDIEGMKKLAGARGYELTDEFIQKMSSPAEESAPAAEGAEGVSAEEVEDAQEVEPGEAEESESEGGEEESSESEESESTGSEDAEEESEEDEKKKARELYDLD